VHACRKSQKFGGRWGHGPLGGGVADPVETRYSPYV